HLEDTERGEARVVVEDPPVVLAVGKDLVLHGQEDAGRVDEVDDGQPVVERHLLRPQHLLDAERELGAGLDGGVVRDHHHRPAVDLADDGHDAGARSAAVLFVHPPRRPEADLDRRGAGVEERRHALARRELAALALLPLRLDAAAEPQALLLRRELGEPRAPVGVAAGEGLVALEAALQDCQCNPPVAGDSRIVWCASACSPSPPPPTPSVAPSRTSSCRPAPRWRDCASCWARGTRRCCRCCHALPLPWAAKWWVTRRRSRTARRWRCCRRCRADGG